MNKAVRDNIEKQVLPYITGRLSYENAVDILEDTKLLKEMEDLVQTDKHKIAMANALFVQHMNRTKSQEKQQLEKKKKKVKYYQNQSNLTFRLNQHSNKALNKNKPKNKFTNLLYQKV